jgi:FSR family fosmidomycin resistance protein-like MFS transporter
MKRLLLPALLGLSHGVADASAGLLLGSLAGQMSFEKITALVLLYNLLGFGGQPVAGMITDRLMRPRAVMIAGMLALASALACAGLQPEMSVLLAGVGSAAFHVGGGALALAATRNRAAGPGLFAAPGAVGLATGIALALTGQVIIWPFIIGLVVLAAVALIFKLPEMNYGALSAGVEFQSHDAIIIFLLAAIALRSFVWSAFQTLLEGNTYLLVAMGAAATAGKAIGGVLADRVGWRRWCVGALSLAAILLAGGNGSAVFLLTGVALLQSATPVCLAMMARLKPNQPATAAGLALGLGILFGGIPLIGGLAGIASRPISVAVILVASAASLYFVASRPISGSLSESKNLIETARAHHT